MALLRNGGKGGEHRLKSWKQIASFFGTDERTVKRWEAKRGLPVRRIAGGAKATVYAEIADLELWLKGAEPAAPALPVAPIPRRIWTFGAAALVALLVAAG